MTYSTTKYGPHIQSNMVSVLAQGKVARVWHEAYVTKLLELGGTNVLLVHDSITFNCSREEAEKIMAACHKYAQEQMELATKQGGAL